MAPALIMAPLFFLAPKCVNILSSNIQNETNVVLDQFVDCKFIIHYYTQFTVHKLVQNYFFLLHFLNQGASNATPQLWLLQFYQKTIIQCLWWAKLEKRSNGHPHWIPLETCGDNFH